METLTSKKLVLLLTVFITFNLSAQKITTAWLDSLAYVNYTFKNMDSIRKVHQSINYEFNIDTIIHYMKINIQSEDMRRMHEAEYFLFNIPKDISYSGFLKILNFYEDILLRRELKDFIRDYEYFINKHPEYAQKLDTVYQCKINTLIQKYPEQLMDVLGNGILNYNWRAPCLLQTVLDYLMPEGKYFNPQRNEIQCRLVYKYLSIFNYPGKDTVLMDLFFMEPDTEGKWRDDYFNILRYDFTPYIKERIYRFILTDSLTTPVPMTFASNITQPVLRYIMSNIAFESGRLDKKQLIDGRDTLFADSMYYYYRKIYDGSQDLQKQYKSLDDFLLVKLREYIRKKLDEQNSKRDSSFLFRRGRLRPTPAGTKQ